jgi:uncharacterized protein (TIGR00369 family)
MQRARTVTWEDPQATAALVATLPGIDYLRGVSERRLPPPPIAELFGFEMGEVAEGEVHFRLTPDETACNPMGIVHGGTLCTLLDTAAGCAVHSLLPAGVGFTTIEIKVSYTRAVRVGTPLVAVGRVLKRGRSVAFAEAEAHDADGALVGAATTSLLIATG